MAPEDRNAASNSVPDQESSTAGSDRARAMSRRDLLTGAGAVAAAVGLGASGTAEPADAAPAEHAGRVGIDKPGVNAGEFKSWIRQGGSNGEAFVSFGFLTKLAGATDDDLFTSEPHNEASALLTVYAEGALQQRVFGQNVHTLDVVGTLTVYERSAPGASAGDPTSFQVGTPVAQFALTLQDVLTVFAPGRGLPTLSGDMHQTQVGHLAGVGKHFGRLGMPARVLATGIGQRPNPSTFDTSFEMAGNWTSEEGRPGALDNR